MSHVYVVLFLLLHFWLERKDNKIKGPCKERKQILISNMKMNTTRKKKKKICRGILNASIGMIVYTIHLKLGILKQGANRRPIRKIY